MDLPVGEFIQLGALGVFAYVVWRTVVMAVDKGLAAFKEQADTFTGQVKELVKPMSRVERRQYVIMERQRTIANHVGLQALPHEEKVDNGSLSGSIEPPTGGDH